MTLTPIAAAVYTVCAAATLAVLAAAVWQGLQVRACRRKGHEWNQLGCGMQCLRCGRIVEDGWE